jgi:hypothetical protein
LVLKKALLLDIRRACMTIIHRTLFVILLALLYLLFAYESTYVVWSRCFAWSSGRLWCFYDPPKGLVSLDVQARYYSPELSPDEVWEQKESLPGLLFCPCISLDEALTGRIYVPTHKGGICWD